MTLPANPKGELHRVTRDGHAIWELRCPQCGHWGEIDEDQLHGRVSTDHTHSDTNGNPICTFHETRNWFEAAERVR